MGIIDFYEGDNTYKDARKAKMKALSAKWLTLLNEAHANGNFSVDPSPPIPADPAAAAQLMDGLARFDATTGAIVQLRAGVVRRPLTIQISRRYYMPAQVQVLTTHV